MTTQARCKFCMQPKDRHLVGCPAYIKPEYSNKDYNPQAGGKFSSSISELFGDIFGNGFDTKGKK